jgi:hypothetical protein
MAASKNVDREANLGLFVAVRETKNFVRFEHEFEDDRKALTMYVPNEVVTDLGEPDRIEVVLRTKTNG